MLVRRRWSVVTVLVGAIVCAQAASGQTYEEPMGVFVAASGAGHYRQPAVDEAARSTFSTGYTFNMAGGYRWRTVRAEGEVSLFRNAFDTITLFVPGGSLPAEPAQGHARGVGVLGMVYYDVPAHPKLRLRPYLGLGGGTYRLRVDGLTSPTLQTFPLTVHATSPFTRVFQLRGGAVAPVGARTDVTAGYRWFRGFPVRFEVPGVGELRPGGARTHGVEAGLRYTF